MASPAPAELQNGISTPPTTANGAPNPSPQTASSTQPNTQSQPQASQNSQAPASSTGPASIPINPSHPLTSLQDSGAGKRPRDARLIHILLMKMGVHAYTERVPLQLLDYTYRYTSGILSDAISYEPPAHASAASKKAAAKDEETISSNALKTAISARAAYQLSPALPKEFMTDIASERNRIALPRVDREFGVRLPPERYCFTGVGWDVKESWEEEVEVDEDMTGSGGPVGGIGASSGAGAAATDTVMGGMEEEEVEEDEFEEVMGIKGDTNMTDG
ncbi:TFIID-31kDa-domain-containing protein [Aaosphaeria arxii CBS 175.79]|uniref:TFIID-31kDa-domain-containing protein n=1 Tax=Aaosphaeria arxii CBS 175.79 TaxID=1450172 RepID=A0A6A5XXI1_9PLEO|nr:TFIID-31kDa-domain-containing protein [Aaosphaeria arxii CBS 175.79]KAF2017656.1 TFIID-31kDa-domain-containing protein [Aaosphaeria arxii CBS 175.79]